MMVLIVNNKIVGSGFSEGWLEKELEIVLGDGGGVLCEEDGRRLDMEDWLDDEGNKIDLFMSCDCMVEMLLEDENVRCYDVNDKMLYISVGNIDLNDEL